ncbi:MAG: HNH endonuclease [Candidatus Vogelbacteria bacterium]|nr:HNH endonuclease [Candidatus Vogelbacteria bacterium]
MNRKRRWTLPQLTDVVKSVYSLRQVLSKLNLKPTGGNYNQVKKYILESKLDTKHFKGKAWNKGLCGIGKPIYSLKDILTVDSSYQSYKLKNRLFKAGLKQPKCEICGWSKKSVDGRTPVELDHINGNNRDNRIINLRILCPNCHSLQSTHRGRNRTIKKPGW